jgi:hypothetical protein
MTRSTPQLERASTPGTSSRVVTSESRLPTTVAFSVDSERFSDWIAEAALSLIEHAWAGVLRDQRRCPPWDLCWP